MNDLYLVATFHKGTELEKTFTIIWHFFETRHGMLKVSERRKWGYTMKILSLFIALFVLFGCANEVGEDVFLDDFSVEPTGFPIEEDITYIEMLVGLQEHHAARLALDNLLFSMTDGFDDELTRARVNNIITILEEVQIQEQVSTGPEFTGSAAVAIAMERFGTSDDFSYFYHETPSFFGPSEEAFGDFTRTGFYVAIKSTEALAAGAGNDAILMLLFVTDDGDIVEMETR